MLLDRELFRRNYLRILDPRDREENLYEQRDGEFWVKHQITHYVDPGRIVEIGVRSGYSGWAMVRAAPFALYTGYDNYHPSCADSDRMRRFRAWAEKILESPGCSIVIQNTQEKGFKPIAADLYHVDGDHSYKGAKRDIENCLDVGFSGSVVVVHDFNAEPVRAAVEDAAMAMSVQVVVINGSPQGDALIFKGHVPNWVHELGAH